MPASGWLAIGSVVAALVAADVGALLVAAVAGSLAAAGWGLSGRMAGRAVLGLAVGAGVLAVRLVLAPAPPPAIAQPPDGSGPWVARVESVVSAAGREPGRDAAPRVAPGGGRRSDPAAVPGDRARGADSRRRLDPTASGGRLRRLSPSDRRRRNAPVATARAPAERTRRRQPIGAASPSCSRSTGCRDPGAGSRPRVGDRDRSPRPRRPRPRGGLHDRRCQPRRGDLGMEHRDRRRLRRGTLRSPVTSPPRSGHGGRDHRLRRVRRGVGVGRAGGGDGRCRADRARERACGSGRGSARLGGADPAARGPASRLGRRVPALRPRDGRDPRLGDAVRAVAWRAERAPARLADGVPRGVPRRPARDIAGRAVVVRAARGRLADRESRRGPARRPGDGRMRRRPPRRTRNAGRGAGRSSRRCSAFRRGSSCP